MSHRGAASSAVPQHQRHGPAAAGAATGPVTTKMSGERSREGFQSGLCWGPPTPARLSGRDAFALPGCAHPPTPAARLRPFSSSLVVAFILLLPILGWFCFLLGGCFFFFSRGSPPRAAMGQGWGTQQAQTPTFGAERPKGTDERHIDTTHAEPSSTQPATACSQLPSQGLRRSLGQKYSYRGGKRKGGGKQGRLLNPMVLIK